MTLINADKMNFHPNGNINILCELRQMHEFLVECNLRTEFMMKMAINREKIARRTIKFRNLWKFKGEKTLGKNFKRKWQNLTAKNAEKCKEIENQKNGEFIREMMEKEFGGKNLKEKEIKMEIEIEDENEEEEVCSKSPKNLENSGAGVISIRQKFADKFQRENAINLGEWRKMYEEMLAHKYKKYHRVRFLFCRKMLKAYGDKLRQIKRTPQELLIVDEKRFAKKFDLEGDILVDTETRKPCLCYEDFFDKIHEMHNRTKISDFKKLYDFLKEDYGNATLLSVRIYWKVRCQLMKRNGIKRNMGMGRRNPL